MYMYSYAKCYVFIYDFNTVIFSLLLLLKININKFMHNAFKISMIQHTCISGPKIKYCLFALDLSTHKNCPYPKYFIVFLSKNYFYQKY